MATITIKYDARNTTINKFIDFIVSLGVEVVGKSTSNKKVNSEVKEIANSYSSVKNGKIKTRPVEQLLDQL